MCGIVVCGWFAVRAGVERRRWVRAALASGAVYVGFVLAVSGDPGRFVEWLLD